MMQIKRPNTNGGLSLTLSFPSLPHVPLLFYKRVKASMRCGRGHVQCTCAHTDKLMAGGLSKIEPVPIVCNACNKLLQLQFFKTSKITD